MILTTRRWCLGWGGWGCPFRPFHFLLGCGWFRSVLALGDGRSKRQDPEEDG